MVLEEQINMISLLLMVLKLDELIIGFSYHGSAGDDIVASATGIQR